MQRPGIKGRSEFGERAIRTEFAEQLFCPSEFVASCRIQYLLHSLQLSTMLFKALGAAVYGIDANLIEVEVDSSGTVADKEVFHTVGLPDAAVRESRDRVARRDQELRLFDPGGRGARHQHNRSYCSGFPVWFLLGDNHQ